MELTSNNLWAGPFVGEFGFELFCWQGILRRISKNYNRVYVSGRPGHDLLYKDFMYEYIPVEAIGFETSGCRNKEYKYNDIHKNYPVNRVIPPNTYLTFYYHKSDNIKFLNTKQQFIKYGRQAKTGIDIVIHARKTYKWKTGYRNWQDDKWDKLVEWLLSWGSVAAIGVKNQAYLPIGAADMRNISLEQLADVLYNARVIIGPSSGPMHFSALCGTPRVSWGIVENKITYEHHWNPFGIYVDYIYNYDWNPPVEIVEDSVKKVLKK